jgi:PTH1 family peptidyl-tRNA hydrolase
MAPCGLHTTNMPGVPLKLIAGLGNPGPEYARTRHNAGFHFVEELARRHGGAFRSDSKHHGELARITLGAHELWLLKPMTYMNRSGGPVRSVASFYKIPPSALLVAYDELDFSPGTVRLKQGGGAAGHNGLRDIIEQMSDAFWRVRIGIGHPGDRSAVLNYVLGRPSSDDAQLIGDAVAAAIDALPVMLNDGAQKAMNQLHTRAAPGTAQE